MGPTLETSRLTLRLPREEDLDGWAALMADEDAAKFIGGPLSRSAAWRAMATMAGSWSLKGFGMFSVIEKASGQWIGRVGPWQPEGWPGREVGWALLPTAWGKGYARESAQAAIDWAFDALDWSEVIHTIDPDNLPSQRLARALGAENVGPTRLPAPLDNLPVEMWRQSREQWASRPTG
ncbi:GNAT family N-acetyltransferase [Croceibacterium sp. LX-88]|uniref:GNAT family N-acetyltransferase n=1 Tax=Croceibacterium selenioxidans TaxID=2838833 RepID=A0ABS5W511_9SPHN|nr:GNAT family N-acetyltransferase [Croceibacterium selenioxidans]MBT2134845.1 GNAT family N-acetyltransferase [Croceibacterium selenioxidans]